MTNTSENGQPFEAEFPAEGRLLGLDYGTKRVGIAISTFEQNIASPLDNYNRQSLPQDQKHLLSIITEYRCKGLVVGLPVHMSGDEGQKAKEARQFGNWVSQFAEIPVRYWDERYSSATAEEILVNLNMSRNKRKAYLDKLAAQIILQSFLDSPNRNQIPESF
ncbi:Holliday junction resolvase RuvX [Gimesia maris]|jgi:putative Holliday junction resolvase|uniref:Putative pre-16S rRNA nuclease n=1 Tax=Gimesia maris TaxID=122 RepID=A0ABX5YPR9_9PLAN|nr:Holliday junction resolvase RuvX [Gimesia maris]EDL60688.1 Holliday junction resolvase YqgF [Gimesia maris DSM 8797]QDU15698.1 Putative Holliday junction resolvase [Gimesia maris]QEG17725.1 Putative Holliday junction resolvase [Gimesia maris]QGQ29234.1 Holliday junction resolvase RuvX [Gimesia maris]|tara:strand:+ start:75453 stop:75941 length:489 start_codon:yes stop_codon:yes gene_type:complete